MCIKSSNLATIKREDIKTAAGIASLAAQIQLIIYNENGNKGISVVPTGVNKFKNRLLAS